MPTPSVQSVIAVRVRLLRHCHVDLERIKISHHKHIANRHQQDIIPVIRPILIQSYAQLAAIVRMGRIHPPNSPVHRARIMMVLVKPPSINAPCVNLVSIVTAGVRLLALIQPSSVRLAITVCKEPTHPNQRMASLEIYVRMVHTAHHSPPFRRHVMKVHLHLPRAMMISVTVRHVQSVSIVPPHCHRVQPFHCAPLDTGAKEAQRLPHRQME